MQTVRYSSSCFVDLNGFSLQCFRWGLNIEGAVKRSRRTSQGPWPYSSPWPQWRHSIPRSPVPRPPKKMTNWDIGTGWAQECEHWGEWHREVTVCRPRGGRGSWREGEGGGVAGAPWPSGWTLCSNAHELVCCGPYRAEPGWRVWILF